MSRLNLNGRATQWIAIVVVAVAAGLVVLEVTGNDSPQEAQAGAVEPAILEPVGDGTLTRVLLSEHAAERIGVETAPVSGSGSRLTVPYAAILYDHHGDTWVYTSPSELTYVRAEVDVESIDGDRAVLRSGPSAGTEVVTLGAAEIYGTEFEVDH